MHDDDDEVNDTPGQKLLIGGHWLEGQEWYEVSDKLNGDVLASVPICDDEMYEMAVLAARDAAAYIAALAPDERAYRLRDWAQRLQDSAAEVSEVLFRESAIPIRWAQIEVEQSISVLRRSATEAELSDTETVALPSGSRRPAGTIDFTIRHPVGAVAALLPDRHPLYFAAQLVGAALATGCPIIVKASPMAPLAVMKLMEMGSDQNWPPGSINLLYGTNRELGRKLAADSRVVLLVVAGLVREIEALGAVRGTRPIISVGSGYGCAILDRKVDVELAAKAILGRRFKSPYVGRPGPYFVLVPKDLTSRVTKALASGVSAMVFDDLSSPDADIPWQISDTMARRATDWLKTIKQTGARVICGGERTGACIHPAIILASTGYSAIAPPPSDAPFLVVDSYDKQFQRHLARYPDLEEAFVFTGAIQSAMELARLPEVPRVDVYTLGSEGNAPEDSRDDADQLRRVISGMTRRKWVELHLTG